MKKLLNILFIAPFFIASCTINDGVSDNTKITTFSGPTGLGLAKAMVDADLDVSITTTTEIAATVSKCDFDLATVSIAQVSALSKSDCDFKIAATVANNPLQLLSISSAIDSESSKTKIESLSGEKIIFPATDTVKYAVEATMINYSLEKKVTMVPTNPSEIVSSLIKNEAFAAFVPEPLAATMMSLPTAKFINYGHMIDLQPENGDNSLIDAKFGLLLVNTEYYNEHTNKTKDLLNEIRESYDWMSNYDNLDAAKELVLETLLNDEIDLGASEANFDDFYKNAKVGYTSGESVKTYVQNYFKELNKITTVDETIPSDDHFLS